HDGALISISHARWCNHPISAFHSANEQVAVLPQAMKNLAPQFPATLPAASRVAATLQTALSRRSAQMRNAGEGADVVLNCGKAGSNIWISHCHDHRLGSGQIQDLLQQFRTCTLHANAVDQLAI